MPLSSVSSLLTVAASSAAITLMLSLTGFPVRANASDLPKKLTFCYENQNYLPFVRQSPGGQVIFGQNGILPDMVLKATKRLGIEAHFIQKPWKRCIHLLKTGRADGLLPAIWQQDREDWGLFPKRNGQPDSRYRVWQADYMVYSHKASALRWDGVRFQGLRAGLSSPLGYVSEKKLRQLKAISPLSYLPIQGLHLVAKQRLDGYVLERSIGDYLVSAEQLSADITPLKIPFLSADWYLPVSHHLVRQHPDAAQQLWRALAKIREQEGPAFSHHYRQHYLQTQHQPAHSGEAE